jgi:imidazolonepropionase-like amidohydrolase
VQVTFRLGSERFDVPLILNLPYAAAQAVAFGLPEAEALKGLTISPRQLAGAANRLGSIEPGREVSPESRHTRLYEKYKDRPRPE